MTFQQQTWIDGEWLDVIHVRDRGLSYGDGLFETLRYQGGRIPLLRWHMQRLQAGAVRLRIPLDLTKVENGLSAVTGRLEQSGVSLAVLKILVTRGCGGRGYAPPSPADTRPTVILQSHPWPDSGTFAQTGVVLHTCHTFISANPLLAGIKHLNRLDYVLAAQDLPQDPSVQGLLLDSEGKLLECLHHNLFLISGDRLRTPQLRKAGVHGIMRRLLMEQLAPQLGLSCIAEDLDPQDLAAADEVFICNSVRGLWPVRAWDKQTWISPGAMTSQLQLRVEEIFDGLVNVP
jgi:4-amino-4-deoxychorismate lyase